MLGKLKTVFMCLGCRFDEGLLAAELAAGPMYTYCSKCHKRKQCRLVDLKAKRTPKPVVKRCPTCKQIVKD